MKGVSKVKEKIISINNKHNEVITLANKGLNETEIARKLNMGKGEIQLILGVNR
jgi:orotate phosphoribosyltransferase-like protein